MFSNPLTDGSFDDGELRGYQFSGTGSYGDELLGDTCPTSNGGPNGFVR